MKAPSLWMLFVLLVTGCSAAPVEPVQQRANGQYRLKLIPLVWLNSAGYSCYAFTGALILNNGVLSGELRKQSGPLYLLNGGVLQGGTLSQARLENYMERVALSGQLTTSMGSGRWRTEAGCRGVWLAEPIH